MSQPKIEIGNDISRNEGGVLAALWKKILRETNHTNKLDYFVERYVRKTDLLQGRSKNVKRKTKSSLIKNISDSEITWKTFLDLLFNFINVKKIGITIKLTFPSGEETIHSVTIDNIEFSDDEEDSSTKDKK